ncbi:MAG: thiol peroxidase [Pseudomonadota bacterium]|nr:thiol peroxidase [Pseudomonadota bacterium]
MATVTLNGDDIHTNGELPAIGSQAPDFRLVATDLSDVGLGSYAGKKKVLNIVVSLDTGVCAKSAREFNEKIADRDDAVVLTISADLPGAQARFCSAEGIRNVETLSIMRNRNFPKDYGVLVVDGPLEGTTARAIVVLDADNRVVHTELVPEIATEPDYEKAMAALG